MVFPHTQRARGGGKRCWTLPQCSNNVTEFFSLLTDYEKHRSQHSQNLPPGVKFKAGMETIRRLTRLLLLERNSN
jgi:hypothetical protein